MARAINALLPKIRNAIDLKEFKILAKHHLKRSMLYLSYKYILYVIFNFSSRKFVSAALSSISCLIVNLLRSLFKLAV